MKREDTMKREDIHIRDPFVFSENGIYYLLGTTGDDSWGDLTLFISSDLENFQKKSIMVTDGSLDTYTDIWAPELHKYNDAYYLILSVFRKDKGRGCLIYRSDSLEKSFTALTGEYITPAGWECLDATLFVYKNKPYLCFSNEWVAPITNDGDGSLYICELNPDLTALVGKPKKIISGKYCGFSVEVRAGGKEGYVAEGPYLYEENDTIVLLWSTFTKNGYAVVKSVSKDGIMGEYKFEKLLVDSDGGHSMSFLDLNGKRNLTFHQPNRPSEERMQLFLLD